MDYNIIDLDGIIKRRSQGGVSFELHAPEIHLQRGHFVAVVGDSGCGKSTLLDILALVSQPSEMENFAYHFGDSDGKTADVDVGVLWRKDDEQGLAGIRKSKLGYVLQTGGLLPFLSVRQNIRLPTRINGYENPDYVEELAGRFGLGQVLAKKPQYLSGGQRQRVAILRALIHRPQMILADEPTAAVDKKRAQAIVSDFNKLAKESGVTVVMVTHDHDLVSSVADATIQFELETVSDSFTRSTAYVNTGNLKDADKGF
uniref:Putative ABC transport system ATP-binding protein n=1 Tax=Candidatus Kentrum sp. UNK TaxID=2126344 RepID=A0A451AX45_9GAMM|nr:MAG: putative ABC transport system ATP-binding protein [Candidatus Kentron sp. UNK]VFK70608.1 MAG: putative ABC transport system ATP-binding protein [Candidatus Kentron sp. UNK]